MGVDGYVHFGLSISNLNRSVEFYRDMLGFEVLFIKTNAFDGLGTGLGLAQTYAELNIAMMKLPSSDVILELIEYKEPKGEPYHQKPGNAGACHIAFRVDDLKAYIERMKEKGVKLNSDANIQTQGEFKGWKWVYFRDPDGINLELIEQPPV